MKSKKQYQKYTYVFLNVHIFHSLAFSLLVFCSMAAYSLFVLVIFALFSCLFIGVRHFSDFSIIYTRIQHKLASDELLACLLLWKALSHSELSIIEEQWINSPVYITTYFCLFFSKLPFKIFCWLFVYCTKKSIVQVNASNDRSLYKSRQPNKPTKSVRGLFFCNVSHTVFFDFILWRWKVKKLWLFGTMIYDNSI